MSSHAADDAARSKDDAIESARKEKQRDAKRRSRQRQRTSGARGGSQSSSVRPDWTIQSSSHENEPSTSLEPFDVCHDPFDWTAGDPFPIIADTGPSGPLQDHDSSMVSWPTDTSVEDTPLTPPGSRGAGSTRSPHSFPVLSPSFNDAFGSSPPSALSGVRSLPADGSSSPHARKIGRPVLHAPSAGGHVGVVRILPESGADVNAHDEQGATALHLSAARGHHKIVAQFLRSGADPNVADRNGLTSLDRAAENGHESTLRLVIQHGATVMFELEDIEHEPTSPHKEP